MDPLARHRLLRLTGVELRHLPGLHDQKTHGRRGPKAATKKAVKVAVEAVVSDWRVDFDRHVQGSGMSPERAKMARYDIARTAAKVASRAEQIFSAGGGGDRDRLLKNVDSMADTAAGLAHPDTGHFSKDAARAVAEAAHVHAGSSEKEALDAMWAAAGTYGAHPIGRSGGTVDFDPQMHRPLAGEHPPKGTRVQVHVPGVLADDGQVLERAIIRGEPAPEVEKAQPLGVFDRLLGDGPNAIKHKLTRQIVEQMEVHGWKLDSHDSRYGVTNWSTPDGRRLSIQFHDEARPLVRIGQRDLTFKAALAHVVTPTIREPGRPNIFVAHRNLGLPELEPYSSDPTLTHLYAAQRDIQDNGFSPEGVAKGVARLRETAQRFRANAREADAAFGMPDSRSPLWLRRADEFEQVADELERMHAARQAYEVAVEKAKTASLDIRPPRVRGLVPVPKAPKTRATKAFTSSDARQFLDQLEGFAKRQATLRSFPDQKEAHRKSVNDRIEALSIQQLKMVVSTYNDRYNYSGRKGAAKLSGTRSQLIDRVKAAYSRLYERTPKYGPGSFTAAGL